MTTSTEKETKHLFSALVKAQQIAKAVEKESRNKFHNYDYASSEDMISEGRHALSEAGLAFFPIDYEIVYGNGSVEDALRAIYLVAHGESGESIEVKSSTPIVPEKGKPADKAASTAKTYDLAYEIRGLLLLPRVERGSAPVHVAGEPDSRDDSNHTPKKIENKKTTTTTTKEEEGPSAEDLQTLSDLAKKIGPEKALKIAGKASNKLGPLEIKEVIRAFRLAIKVRDHDWYWQMSDAPGASSKGRIEADEIKQGFRQLPNDLAKRVWAQMKPAMATPGGAPGEVSLMREPLEPGANG